MGRFMLKRRIIPIQLLSNGRLVKTTAFEKPKDVGDPEKSSKIYSDQDADELILLNINRKKQDINDLALALKGISRSCFVPLTVGGGINSLEDASLLFESGADKIIINSSAYSNIKLINKISEKYGRQSVVIGIDVRKLNDLYTLHSACGQKIEKVTLQSHIESVTAAGAGEILIQRIEYDGLMSGYDLDLLDKVIALSRLPVISAAGAGNFVHLKAAFLAGADAVACGSLFNFGDNNPLRAKSFLKNYAIPLKRI